MKNNVVTSSKRNLVWTVLLCLFGLSLQTGAYAQERDKKVSLTCEEEALPDALNRIERQSGYYKMNFNYDELKAYKVTATIRQKTAPEAVDILLQGLPFTKSVNGKFIQIAPVKANVFRNGEKKSISGKVVDASGQPLPGVAVQIEGTTWGAISDMNGRFDMPSHNLDVAVLLVSFVGMKDQKVLWNGKSLDIVLVEDVAAMEEVVVTGIFKKAKESYTGSASFVTNEQLEIYRGQNLLQTLKNIDVSINMAENNMGGSNPNNLPQISIRGNSSLPMNVAEYNQIADNSVNTPLIVLDGFEIGLERLMDYNDDEIQSITILKDAAATAIYGSRGSNGVIVVVTKQPEAGKLRLNAEIGINLEVPDLTSYDLLNAAEKLKLEWDLGLYAADSPQSDMTYKNTYARRMREVAGGTDIDWLGKPLRVGAAMRYNLRMEGGSNEFRWSITGSYNDTNGAMKDSYRKTFNGSITLMYKVKNLIFRNYTSFGLTNSRESKYGNFGDYVKQQPYNRPYDDKGNLIKVFEHFSGSTGQTGNANPLYDATLNTFNKSGNKSLTNNFSIEWQPLESLTLRGQVGITGGNNTRDRFLPAEHSYFLSSEFQTSDGFLRRGSYNYSTGESYSYNGNLTLSYSKTFAEKHQIYVGVDYSLSESIMNSYSFAAEGFMDEDIHHLGAARKYAENQAPSGSESKSRRLGFAGNINYVYNNRYYADFSLRIDGSSSFGAKKNYGTFWSSGIGWNIHNETFMQDSFMDVLRLKASYGLTGSQHGSTGASTLYNILTNTYYMNWIGAELQGLGNPYLTWQSTNEFNVGMEFGLWSNRVKGEFNVYSKRTGNLLSNMDLPHSTGFASYVDNVGEVKNRGWEASASVYLIRDTQHDISWMLTGQLAYNKNTVSKLSDAIKAQTESYLQSEADVATLFYEGRPQNGLYVVRSLGIDPSNGQEIFLDKDGNRTDVWKPSDKVYVGHTDPSYRGIASSMFRWKGLTVNVSAGYHWGGVQYNQDILSRVEVGRTTLINQNVDARALYERWQKPGDIVSFKKFGEEATKASSRFVMDDKVFQIQSVNVSYRWDNDWVKKNLHASSITLGVNMSDLLYLSTIKRERGLNYPFSRNIQGNLQLVF